MADEIVKECKCCGATYSAATWRRLPLVARNVDICDDGSELLDMRNCPCSSTLAIVVGGTLAAKAAS